MLLAYFELINKDTNYLTLALQEGVLSEEGVMRLLKEVQKHSLFI
jgi:hypothetical protein